ncbi:DUF305 domain-containing protein [Pontibacter sp. Tf4]|uniref:DUF305 domain-containing protein n=1 Tax=Pontibacter sp. Tf4 TaxID=2761620 RepID=UPI001623DDA2|nr:DUF305 domain-containing protein [Pontibacter sp. Tf4]MBB6613045.1 DUF305 domain-containing protein [Pontibacter sp. Tf4]
MENETTLLMVGAFLFIAACGGGESTTEETTTTEVTTGETSEAAMDTDMAPGSMLDLMHQNMQQMQDMTGKMTGDPDYDFALLMEVHHKGAVEMAEEELANGTDSQMKEMAQKTVDQQSKEMNELQAFINQHKPTSGDTATTMKMVHAMQNMMGEMHQDDRSARNTDQSFAQMMIQHHQMGLDMTKAYLSMGKDQQLKQEAQKTMDQQSKEIKELEAWLQEQPK